MSRMYTLLYEDYSEFMLYNRFHLFHFIIFIPPSVQFIIWTSFMNVFRYPLFIRTECFQKSVITDIIRTKQFFICSSRWNIQIIPPQMSICTFFHPTIIILTTWNPLITSAHIVFLLKATFYCLILIFRCTLITHTQIVFFNICAT